MQWCGPAPAAAATARPTSDVAALVLPHLGCSTSAALVMLLLPLLPPPPLLLAPLVPAPHLSLGGVAREVHPHDASVPQRHRQHHRLHHLLPGLLPPDAEQQAHGDVWAGRGRRGRERRGRRGVDGRHGSACLERCAGAAGQSPQPALLWRPSTPAGTASGGHTHGEQPSCLTSHGLRNKHTAQVVCLPATTHLPRLLMQSSRLFHPAQTACRTPW